MARSLETGRGWSILTTQTRTISWR
jgi:hypothetical protein